MRTLFARSSTNKTKKVLTRPPLEFFKVVKVARKLHGDMYRAVIGKSLKSPSDKQQDILQVKKLCVEGLRDHLVKLINDRPVNQCARWEIKSVLPHITTRVVSNRVTRLPRDSSILRQIVVRIRSLQRIQRRELLEVGHNVMAKGTKDWEEMNEYLVLQRRIVDGQLGQWKIWGTVEESSYERVLGIKAPKVGDASAIAAT